MKKVLFFRTGLFSGLSDWSRTSGLLNPIQALYQTEPHPDTLYRAHIYYHTSFRFSIANFIFLIFFDGQPAGSAAEAARVRAEIPGGARRGARKCGAVGARVKLLFDY